MNSSDSRSAAHPDNGRSDAEVVDEAGTPGAGSLAGTVRFAAAAGVVMSALAGLNIGTSVILAAVVSLLAADTTRPVALVNIALAHNFLVLEVGPMLIPVQNVERVQWFGASLAVASLVGVVAGRVGSASTRHMVATGRTFGPLPYARSVRLMWVTILVWLVVVVVQVLRTGVASYFSGIGLATDIETYAGRGLSGAQILSLALGVIGSVMLAVHFSIAFRTPGAKLAWWPMLVLGIGLPILDLSRSGVLFSVLALLLAWTLVRDKGMVSVSIAGRLTVALVSFALVFGIGVGIGVMRERALDGGANTESTVLTSEFTPVQVADFALGLNTPPRYRGDSLFVPALTRFVPRRMLSSKPENTTIRFMRAYAPDSYAAGYSIAPTAVGVFLLNFGVIGTLVIWALLMFVTVHLIDRRRSVGGYGAGVLIVLYANAFQLLRNDPSNSIPQVAAAVVLYSFVRYQVIGRSPDA